jgi:low affinity Fe/Cu permease
VVFNLYLLPRVPHVLTYLKVLGVQCIAITANILIMGGVMLLFVWSIDGPMTNWEATVKISVFVCVVMVIVIKNIEMFNEDVEDFRSDLEAVLKSPDQALPEDNILD